MKPPRLGSGNVTVGITPPISVHPSASHRAEVTFAHPDGTGSRVVIGGSLDDMYVDIDVAKTNHASIWLNNEQIAECSPRPKLPPDQEVSVSTPINAKVDGFAIAFPDDIAPFRIREGKLVAFIAGVQYSDEEVFDSSRDAGALSDLVCAAIEGGVIAGDPRLTFVIDADQEDYPNWIIKIRQASSWTPQLSTGKAKQLNGITDAGTVADQIRAAVMKAVDAANEALAELRGEAVAE